MGGASYTARGAQSSRPSVAAGSMGRGATSVRIHVRKLASVACIGHVHGGEEDDARTGDSVSSAAIKAPSNSHGSEGGTTVRVGYYE